MLDSTYNQFTERIQEDGSLSQSDRLFALFLHHECYKRGGEVHMTVRDLGKEVHISTSAVSHAIPRLHAAGYIQADMRRRERPKERQKPDEEERMEEYGYELWHITVPALTAFLSQVLHHQYTANGLTISVYIHKNE